MPFKNLNKYSLSAVVKIQTEKQKEIVVHHESIKLL